MMYTHCLNCGRKLTSTVSQQRGYGWECWKKLQDEAPGLFDDENFSETQKNKADGQSAAHTKRGRVRTRPAQMRKLWALGTRRTEVSPRTTKIARRAGYYRERRFAMRRLPLQTP